MEMDHDFYEILGISRNATIKDIKHAYRKLALKYHPDKCKQKNSQQKFHQIHLAYQILSDNDKRKHYDNLSSDQKNNIVKTIKRVIKDIFNVSNLSQIIVDDNIKNHLINNDYDSMRTYAYNKIYNFLVSNFQADDDDISSIFIKNDIVQNHTEKFYDVMGNDSAFETSYLSDTHSSETQLRITIYTTLEEIYCNKHKELIILRHKYVDDSSNYVMEEKKLILPLYDDKIVYMKEGDEFKNKHGVIEKGDVIIKIKCKKHQFIQRVNDYDLLLFLPTNLYELFYGFKKRIKYFNGEVINLLSSSPLKEYKFDGDKLEITLDNKGLPYYEKNEFLRGKLIVTLLLDKNNHFYDNLKKNFR